MTLYTMIGLPGSGKSTFAVNHPECIVVSTDAIRGELFGDESEQKDGKLVFDVAYARLAKAVEAGQDAMTLLTYKGNTEKRFFRCSLTLTMWQFL